VFIDNDMSLTDFSNNDKNFIAHNNVSVASGIWCGLLIIAYIAYLR